MRFCGNSRGESNQLVLRPHSVKLPWRVVGVFCKEDRVRVKPQSVGGSWSSKVRYGIEWNKFGHLQHVELIGMEKITLGEYRVRTKETRMFFQVWVEEETSSLWNKGVWILITATDNLLSICYVLCTVKYVCESLQYLFEIGVSIIFNFIIKKTEVKRD